MPLPIPVIRMVMALRATLAFVALGATIMTGITILNISSEYFAGPTETPLSHPEYSVAVQFGPNSGSDTCPTCLVAPSDDILLDYYSGQLNMLHFLDNTPTPTLPLKLSYAAPSNIRPKPTPTPPIVPRVGLSPASPPTSSPSSNPLPPPPGASILAILLTWYRNICHYIIDFVYTRSISASVTKGGRGLGHARVILSAISCAIIWINYAAATVPCLKPRLNSWKRSWMRSKGLGKGNESQEDVQLADQLLEKLNAIILGNSHEPKKLVSRIHELLADYFNEARELRAEWHAIEKRKLNEIAKTHIAKTLTEEKAKINQRANREFKRLRKVHQDKLNETYERDVFATADIEASFGPSLRNAESEFRGRLDRVGMEEGRRQGILVVFKNVLYAFAFAIAVDESRPGGSNVRYLSVIEEQNRLIESLRLLHKFREQAIAENEELVRLLCQYDKEGKIIIPDDSEDQRPWTQYSPEDDRFLVSPPDGPTALSTMVSMSSVPFHNGPESVLDSDPYWQRFLASIAAKQSEQEVRLASYKEDAPPLLDHISHSDYEESHDENEVKEKIGVNDSNEDSTDAVPEIEKYASLDAGGVIEESGIKDVITHDSNTPQIQKVSFEKGVVPERSGDKRKPPKNAGAEYKADGHKQKGDGSSDRSLDGQQERESQESDVLDESEYAEWLKGPLKQAESELSWHKWKLEYLKEGYGTPEDSDPKPLSEITPAATVELTGDAAIARQLYEEELAVWRKGLIESCELNVAEWEVTVANLAAGTTASENGATSGEPQAQPLTPTQKRAHKRKKAKAKKKMEALESQK